MALGSGYALGLGRAMTGGRSRVWKDSGGIYDRSNVSLPNFHNLIRSKDNTKSPSKLRSILQDQQSR